MQRKQWQIRSDLKYSALIIIITSKVCQFSSALKMTCNQLKSYVLSRFFNYCSQHKFCRFIVDNDMAIVNIWWASILIFIFIWTGCCISWCIFGHNTWATFTIQRCFRKSPRLRYIFDDTAAGCKIGQMWFFSCSLLFCSYSKCLFI